MAMKEKPIDVKTIFSEALEKKDVKERADYLNEACGNDMELRSKVEALLKAHEQAGSFLDAPPFDADVTLNTSPLTEAPGTIIGRYKLLEQIGEGGFGVVYMAEQQEPIRRRVALKIIKLGMDTRQVIARFEAERQALAMMDHPNIAKVLDAGATETGRPYFVMELVKGIPITEYCDKNNLDTQQRLELFIDVCKAVQHAHQKGIIHRDIKPSNVMITLHDGKPVPKVIDFGIAKATGHRLTEKTLFTKYAQMIGTPEYMSPEQAEMSGLDIDTRTDIYSLGVLLYELLTSATPFDAKELREAGYIQMQRIIRETEPLRPSTKLNTMGDALTDIARHRQSNPDLLPKLVRGDLDWIAMKTLEKDRTRRYETANELAMDIQRHLSDEPVSAGPPSVRYRLAKFVRRHRTGVAAGLLVAAAIMMGLVVSTTMYFQAEQARGREAAARAEAERQGKISQAVANFLTDDLFASVFRFHDSRGDVSLPAVLSAAAMGLEDKFKGEPLVEASIREALGKAYRRRGEYEEAKRHLERAIELRRSQLGEEHPDTLKSMYNLALLYKEQNLYKEAETLYVRTLEGRCRVLGEEHRDTLKSMSDLASVYYYQKQYEKAEALLVKALEIGRRMLGEDDIQNQISMGWLAKVYREQGHNEQAEPLYVEMLEIRCRMLGKEYEKEVITGLVMKELIKLYESWGKPEQANQHRAKLQHLSPTLFFHAGNLDKYLQLWEAWDTAPEREKAKKELPPEVKWMGELAEWYSRQGRYKEAESLYLERLEIQRRALGEEHQDTLASMSDLASMYCEQGQYDKVEPLLTKVLEISRRVLGEEHPDTLLSMNNLGALYQNQGRYNEAEPLLTKALEGRRRVLGEEHPDTVYSMTGLGMVYYRQGRYDKADATLRRSEEIRTKSHLDSHPANLAFIAMALHKLGRTDEAKASLDRLRDLLKEEQYADDQQAKKFLLEAEQLITPAPPKENQNKME
jgi:tetratricopeptide (TPR) repeat protein